MPQGTSALFFFVECLLAVLWAKEAQLLSVGVILKLQRFPGCPSPEPGCPSPEPRCPPSMPIARQPWWDLSVAHCPVLVLGSACPGMQHGGVLRLQELRFEVCGECLHGSLFLVLMQY